MPGRSIADRRLDGCDFACVLERAFHIADLSKIQP